MFLEGNHGGQFAPAEGGQFESATHGQFKSAQGGQFDRSLHAGQAFHGKPIFQTRLGTCKRLYQSNVPDIATR